MLAPLIAVLLLIVSTSAHQIPLYRTMAGTVAAQFGMSSIDQNRILTLDLTSTDMWTFACTDITQLPSKDFLAFVLDADSNTQRQSTLQPIHFSNKSLYDSTAQLNGASTYILGIRNPWQKNVTATEWLMLRTVLVNKTAADPAWHDMLVDGVFGVGRGLMGFTTNYYTYFMNTSSVMFIDAPRPGAKGVIYVDEVPSTCDSTKKAVVSLVNQNSVSQTFDFEIDSTHLNGELLPNRTRTATISSLSTYLSVDADTYAAVQRIAHPVRDHYRPNEWQHRIMHNLVDCQSMRNLSIRFSVRDTTGVRYSLTVPGSDLVKRTVGCIFWFDHVQSSGYCILKIQPSGNDGWVLGMPFIENYCVGLNFGWTTITFGQKLVKVNANSGHHGHGSGGHWTGSTNPHHWTGSSHSWPTRSPRGGTNRHWTGSVGSHHWTGSTRPHHGNAQNHQRHWTGSTHSPHQRPHWSGSTHQRAHWTGSTHQRPHWTGSTHSAHQRPHWSGATHPQHSTHSAPTSTQRTSTTTK